MTSCDWAKEKATEFWTRLEFTHLNPKTKFTEPTLTEILVYDFWKSAEFLGFPFSIFHSTNEKSNGNDLEIAIETIDGDYILFPTQAKIIKRNYKYTTINHKSKHSLKDQLHLLLDYANRKRGIPLYFFYNFCGNAEMITEIKTERGFESKTLGISVAYAKNLKDKFYNRLRGKLNVPDFSSLHKTIAFPFHELFCPTQEFLTSLQNYTEDTKNNVTTFSLVELKNQGWEELNRSAFIGYIEEKYSMMVEEEIDNDQREIPPKVFNPKFRIIISQKPQHRGLYAIN